jgi:hypothetical protein
VSRRKQPPDGPAEELRLVTFKIPESWIQIVKEKSVDKNGKENFSFWIRELIYATFTPAEKKKVPPPEIQMGPKG